MTWEGGVAVAVVGAVFVGLARGVAGPDVLILGAAVLLAALHPFSDRFPPPLELARSFGNEGLLTIGALFVVSAALTETGGVAIVAERLLGRTTSERSALARIVWPTAAFSGVFPNTPLVALMIPVVSDWATRHGFSRSRLLLPLSYAAVLGGTCTLIGTSTNLIVQGFLIAARANDPSAPTMGMFTLTPIGLPVALAGVLYLLWAAPRALRDRTPPRSRELEARQYTVEMTIPEGSPLAGSSIEVAGLRNLPGAYLASIERGAQVLAAVDPQEELRVGDRLMFVGVLETVADLQLKRGLVPATDQVRKIAGSPFDRTLIEAVVSARNPLVGRSIKDGRFRHRYDAAVVAVHRHGASIVGKIGEIVLQPGDTLLLQTRPRFAEKYRDSLEFLVLSDMGTWRPRRHERAAVALAVLVVMVVAAGAEAWTGVSTFLGALLAAGVLGLLGCVSAERARKAIDLPVLIAIAGSLYVGRAVETTGLAGTIADALRPLVDAFGVHGALAGVYVLALLFTELVTNNAAAALMFPIASAIAHSAGVSVLPFAVVVAIGASCGFATPLGYQTHLMVYGPGGYRFWDFVKIGVPLDVLCAMVTLLLVPWVFPF